MKNTCQAFRLLAVVACAALGACSTFEFRAIQSQFNDAVALDNGATVSGNPFANADYESVLAYLTADNITALDARLQANAWLLRSFCELRLDRIDPSEARKSASNGIDVGSAAGSRDDVLLRLMPALIIDREIEVQWESTGRQLTPAQYDPEEHGGTTGAYSYQGSFATALAQCRKAENAVSSATPPATIHYLQFHRWRILSNWRAVILSLHDNGNTDSIRGEELKDAQQVMNGKLRVLAESARDSIPASHTLRALIRAKRGG